MTPIGLVAGADGQVVLAGDPLQLGPVLQSKVAEKHGLGLSYLERLIQFPLYGRDEKKFADHGSYDPLLVSISYIILSLDVSKSLYIACTKAM